MIRLLGDGTGRVTSHPYAARELDNDRLPAGYHYGSGVGYMTHAWDGSGSGRGYFMGDDEGGGRGDANHGHLPFPRTHLS